MTDYIAVVKENDKEIDLRYLTARNLIGAMIEVEKLVWHDETQVVILYEKISLNKHQNGYKITEYEEMLENRGYGWNPIDKNVTKFIMVRRENKSDNTVQYTLECRYN